MAIGFTRIQREMQERNHLCPAGQRSSETRGRIQQIAPDNYRTCYQVDMGLLVFLADARRLARTTQCHPFPNDPRAHVRLYHVMEVSQVAMNTALGVRLNPDLAEAVGFGHDIGQGPFGHAGEKALNTISLRELGKYWKHNTNGLKVVDDVSHLNLTFEVRDGIVCHLGPLEKELVPYGRLPNGDPNPKEPPKDFSLDKLKAGTHERCEDTREFYPSTYEGCIARMADKIVGAAMDVEDGVNLGLIKWSGLPESVQKHLGKNIGEIINNFVTAVIEESWDGYHHTVHSIKMPGVTFQALQELNKFNEDNIYKTPKMEATFVNLVPFYMEFLYTHYTQDSLTAEQAITKIAMMTDEEALSEFKIIGKTSARGLRKPKKGPYRPKIPKVVKDTLVRYYILYADNPKGKKISQESALQMVGEMNVQNLIKEFNRIREKVKIHRQGS